ncbi:hypothetical protein DL95DRAFT_468346 [Leptodontidium sp. 2 PMI_412]|nr:hypothetical protein DL95DRAFT_468346 [Leptodontidium sp. 2 PMI_412]
MRISCGFHDGSSATTYFAALPAVNHEPYFSQLGSRAWACQEWYLSRRMIFYTKGGFSWKCKGVQFDKRRIYYDMHESDWESLLQRYTGTNLTHESDCLIALQGIANSLKRKPGRASTSEKHNLSLSPEVGKDRDERQFSPGGGSERFVERVVGVEDSDEARGSEESELRAQEVAVDSKGKDMDEPFKRREDDSLRIYDVDIEPEEQQKNSDESRDGEEREDDRPGQGERESLKSKASDYLRKHDVSDIIPEDQDSSSQEGNNAESEPEQLQQEDVEEENRNKEEYDYEAEMETDTDTPSSIQHIRDLSPPLPYAETAKGAYVHWVLLLAPVEE